MNRKGVAGDVWLDTTKGEERVHRRHRLHHLQISLIEFIYLSKKIQLTKTSIYVEKMHI
uniref:Squamosa promoter binding n=1 Tax=Solanum tuberosum TaxID=4113 RepID=M1D694_SOLTU